MPKLNLGLRMLVAMEAAGFRSGEMAKALQVSRHSVSGWLANRHVPNHSTLVRWAELCGNCDVDWLEHAQFSEHVDSEGMKEEIARKLVAQLLGSQRQGYYPFGRSLEEEDLAPIIDLDEPYPHHARRLAPTG